MGLSGRLWMSWRNTLSSLGPGYSGGVPSALTGPITITGDPAKGPVLTVVGSTGNVGRIFQFQTNGPNDLLAGSNSGALTGQGGGGPNLGNLFVNNDGIRAGVGAPNNATGADGDFYFRVDGGALSTIYQRRAGVYVGIV